MKRLQRITALLLCIAMILPAPQMTVFAETISWENQEVITEAAEETELVETELTAEEETTETELIEETSPVETIEEEEPSLEEEEPERIDETLPLEEIPEEEDSGRINETLPLIPLEDEAFEFEVEEQEEGVIYWNPGGAFLEEYEKDTNKGAATASDAEKATPSNARRGSDRLDGSSASKPVKTLKAVLKRAEEMQEEEGLAASEITIYVMNPLEIPDGQLYVVNGGGIHFTSWPDRAYDNDSLFYVNGGQLTLINLSLESGDPEQEAELSELVYVQGGTLQMGENVSVNGRIVMDYRSEEGEVLQEAQAEADVESESNSETHNESLLDAVLFSAFGIKSSDRKNKTIEFFNINDYDIDVEEDEIKLIRETKAESTWRKPVIELLEGFEDNADTYILEVRGDSSTDQVELVKTLYADEHSEEEFADRFILAVSEEEEAEPWSLAATSKIAFQDVEDVIDVEENDSAESQETDTDTDEIAASDNDYPEEFSEILAAPAELLTQKTLIATRSKFSKVVYWNPGREISVGGITYPAGDDGVHDGFDPEAPVRTWEQALIQANGNATIVSMQSIYLNNSTASDYIPVQPDGSYLISAESDTKLVALKTWELNPQPAFVVGETDTLVLKDIILQGNTYNGIENHTEVVWNRKGTVIIGGNVTAKTGFITVEIFADMEDKTIKITSTEEAHDGIITLNFPGINNNRNYQYKDVVVPYGDLEAFAAAGNAEAVGQAMQKRVVLHPDHRNEAHGGRSLYDWYLRQDTAEDDGTARPENLELYADYYYDAIYLDGVRGKSYYAGESCERPIDTWDRVESLWEEEMARSIAARRTAEAEGFGPAEINQMYPFPSTIYICGKVTVNTAGTVWTLHDQIDYDGSVIKTEVVIHTEAARDEGTGTPVHTKPEVLVEVTGTGELTIKDILIRNITDEKDSKTIEVKDGGKLTLTGKTVLTGERFAEEETAAKPVTYGDHVVISGGSTFTMDAGWTGSIEKRQHGVTASGSGTKVIMDAGSIQGNNSFDQVLYDNDLTNQSKGAGIVLSGGAAFIMNGGEIADNTTYQYGAGVYLTGTNTTFTLNKGTIKGNQMAGEFITSSSDTEVQGYGIGIYAGEGTVLNVGTAGGLQSDVLISENRGYLTEGVGIWTDGQLKIQNSVVSQNTIGSTKRASKKPTSKGLGIYVGNHGLLQMESVLVSENIGYNSDIGGYGSVIGAGIYLSNATNKNYIKKSTISENKTGLGTSGKSGGGGISVLGYLDIEDTEIIDNVGIWGGGLRITGSASQRAEVTIKNTVIKDNQGCGVDDTGNIMLTAAAQGGGIRIEAYAKLELFDGTSICNNSARSGGGGIYAVKNSELFIRGIKPGAIKINNNQSNSSGGGLWGAGSVYISNAEFLDNKSDGNGGAIYNYTGKLVCRKTVIKGNEASTNGGGIYSTVTATETYLSDCKIEDNTAKKGGGIYTDSTAHSILYLTESVEGEFVLSGNKAETGGGVYQRNARATFAITGPIKNSASVQGSNLYSESTSTSINDSYIVKGTFSWPEDPESGYNGEDVYNIYVDHEFSNSLYFDLDRVRVEKKSEGNPKVIYLNTPGSAIKYFKEPPSNDYGIFQIDVNPSAFDIGSIVVSASGGRKTITTASLDEDFNQEGQNDVYASYYKIENTSYSSGGSLPRRTELNIYNGNIIIGEEGVYLKTVGGSDNNDGLSPETPVKTFEKAKEVLEEQIKAKQASEAQLSDESKKIGFTPIIYICGTVEIKADNEVWELKYDDPLFTETNINYITSERAAGKQPHPAQVRRFASFVNAPMINVISPGKFQLDNITIDGMANAVQNNTQSTYSPIIYVRSGAETTLKGNAKVTNNYSSGIKVEGKLFLTGEEGEENKQLLNHVNNYIELLGDDPYIEMGGNSRILKEGIESRVYSEYAIYSYDNTPGSRTVIMRDYSSISGENPSGFLENGIHISSTGKDVTVDIQMKDHASIVDVQHFGISTNLSNASSTGAIRIAMENSAQIDLSSVDDNYCRAINIMSINAPANIMINHEEPAGKVKLKSSSRGGGIDLNETKNAYISMGGEAEIIGKPLPSFNDVNGIDINNAYSPPSGGSIQIHMAGKSKISNYKWGILLGYMPNNPIHVTMAGEAAIENNTYGIGETDGSDSYFIRDFTLEMKEESRISGNVSYGICQMGRKTGSDSNWKIIMEDQAIIGGESPYQETDPTSGNGAEGIYSNGPVELLMSGSSRISGNGGLDNTNAVTLYRKPINTSFAYRPGTSKITLTGNASISNNKGGIVMEESTSAYPNPGTIILDGSVTGSRPSIEGNTDAVYLLGKDQKIELEGNACVGDTAYESDRRSMVLNGALILDGNSTIEGVIHLREQENPITMTAKVTDPEKVFNLWLYQRFIGNVVVQPNDPSNTSGGVTDVTDQLAYFVKKGGEGAAEEKILLDKAPNIVLQGENNVYLSGSGSGNDANNGNSPDNPVRTFARAKQLLETGYFTKGANIIICNKMVDVQKGDENWFFENGEVTNAQTGDTWTPVVTRYEGYHQQLIGMPDPAEDTKRAQTLTLSNIIIDGGSEQGITALGSSSDDKGGAMLTIERGSSVTLGEGAVLQNNQSVDEPANETVMGVFIDGGTLEIDGGVIKNMVREYDSALPEDSRYMASAIYSRFYSKTYPGTINLKSGKIEDNQINFSGADSGSHHAGTILLNGSEMGMSGGAIEGNQSPYRGSGILYLDGSLILSGGRILENTPSTAGVEAKGPYSPVYVEGGNFQLKGGGADIEDNIYLASNESLVKISGRIYQAGRRYHIYLNQPDPSGQPDVSGQPEASNQPDTLPPFQKGDVVVQPDGIFINDATPYLSYFVVYSNPLILDLGRTSNYAGTVTGVTEKNCLLLMRGVYLDSVNGSDTAHDGNSPLQAVSTFKQAKGIGGRSGEGKDDYYVIYLSGKAVNTAAEPLWSLPDTAYMCRYTGFPVYDKNGNRLTAEENPYYNYLIEPAHPLRLENLSIYGRRVQDPVTSSGESMLKVNPGISVNIGDGAVLERNYNLGNDAAGTNLEAKGGAAYVLPGGRLTIEGGVIQDTDASYGSAVYLAADQTNSAETGHLYLKGTPEISGKVYLDGTGVETAAYIEPDHTYEPESPIGISIGNDYNGRPVVSYPNGTIPGAEERSYYKFDDGIQGLYDIVNRSGAPSTLELLMRRVIYLDGQRADNGGDGQTPKTAFKTLRQVYEAIKANPSEGTAVFVVGTVEISSSSIEPSNVQMTNVQVKNSDGSSYYEGNYTDHAGSIPVRGQVVFKRYARPDGPDTYTGYENETLKGSLFHVMDGGNLEISGIYLDGHSQDSLSDDPLLTARGVAAEAPLITVEGTGVLKAALKKAGSNEVALPTVFSNNNNGNKNKTEKVGQLDGEEIIEGSSAGIELLKEGSAYLQAAEFKNLQLDSPEMSGGSDVYSNGNLQFSEKTLFEGSVYLEGLGTEQTSRYLVIDKVRTPVLRHFQVLMRDPYAGRTVVQYPSATEVPDSSIGTYRLEDQVRDFFYLAKREGYPYILELQVPIAVYIDGTSGVDERGSGIDGAAPDRPIKTLKRAYELLLSRGGSTIYVVDTVETEESFRADGTSYIGDEGEIYLGSTSSVRLTRYIQPDFARDGVTDPDEEHYAMEDFTGPLFKVTDGKTASFGSGFYFDGHSQPKKETKQPKETMVSRSSASKAPLIFVEPEGTLELLENTYLVDNDNDFNAEAETEGLEGGAIYNSGKVLADGTTFTNNQTYHQMGSGVYQDGVFTILSAPELLKDHSFYLTTENTGTADAPVWGEDHLLQIAVPMPEDPARLIYGMDMDRPEKGREVIRFTDETAYSPSENADPERDHFELGSTVPEEMFLVVDDSDPAVLELQNWEVLDVELPENIYLVVQNNGTTSGVKGIHSDAPESELLSSPHYRIKNKGNYDVKVSVSSFQNQNAEAGITGHEVMNLTDTPEEATGDKDLYLAIKGLDTGETGLIIPETSLRPLSEESVEESAMAELGQIKSKSTGKFSFIGYASQAFIEKYQDSSFPMTGGSIEDVQAYLDGTNESSTVNARAKYEMKFKIELDTSESGEN